jgi:hypothetical protein
MFAHIQFKLPQISQIFTDLPEAWGTIWNPGNHEELFPTAKDAEVAKVEGIF